MKQPKLNGFAKEVYEANLKKGFDVSKENIGQSLMLIVSELSEALEACRKERFTSKLDVAWMQSCNDDKHLIEEHFPSTIKDTFEDEIADTFIRLLDLVGGLKIDIDFHIEAKLRYNKTRIYKHGKKF